MTSTLSSFALRFHSDKGETPWVPTQHVHGYTRLYENLFAARRQESLSILDIGAWGENQGGSALMWREYFPNAQVFALDYYAEVESLNAHDRITAFRCNLDDEPSTIDKLTKHGSGRGFDIVIDDASHYPPQQMRNLLHASPLLRKGFQYVIEDIDLEGSTALQHAVEVDKRLPHMSAFEWAWVSSRASNMQVMTAKPGSKVLYIT